MKTNKAAKIREKGHMYTEELSHLADKLREGSFDPSISDEDYNDLMKKHTRIKRIARSYNYFNAWFLAEARYCVSSKKKSHELRISDLKEINKGYKENIKEFLL